MNSGVDLNADAFAVVSTMGEKGLASPFIFPDNSLLSGPSRFLEESRYLL